MEERQLIEGCVRGESWAQKTVYELHAPAMMSVCQRYVCDRETARDLLHDGFVKLFTKIHTYSGAGSFNGWMRRIFVTTALEHLRRNDVLRNSVDIGEFDGPVAEPDVSLFEHLSSSDLLACIASLPDGYRTVFNMHAIEGYSHVEIARELDVSESTSRSQYARARQLLQKTVMDRVEKLEVGS
ncbi:MAG: sigma-70 family RNA polymerase sigma factor [Bacteroidales bacterium]|jgi:RNA polymerase sigma-70 factor (ECF subfamily)|nr:sigma-70 family RNA polymerase sigma factor [Bacteroidales bacterium]